MLRWIYLCVLSGSLFPFAYAKMVNDLNVGKNLDKGTKPTLLAQFPKWENDYRPKVDVRPVNPYDTLKTLQPAPCQQSCEEQKRTGSKRIKKDEPPSATQ